MDNRFKTIDDVGKRYRFLTTLPIVGDEEGLLLTSYQLASEHTAERIVKNLGKVPVLEICCGVGGTTVFLAKYLPHVYAVDLSSTRIEAAKINAKTFGVEDKITFIHGDGLDETILKKAKNDGVQAVITDVEWRNNLSKTLQETTPNIEETIPSTPRLYEQLSQLVTSNIAMHMAANSNKNQLTALADCEVEELTYQGITKFINVYFGSLIDLPGISNFAMV